MGNVCMMEVCEVGEMRRMWEACKWGRFAGKGCAQNGESVYDMRGILSGV